MGTMTHEPLAVMGNFHDPDKLIHAAEQIRDAGYSKWDIYTPYPVHGLEKAMGEKKTKVPLFSAAGALFGLANAVFLLWWTGAVDYKLNIGGKQLFIVWFGTPIMFELTILLTGIVTFLAMFIYFCKLPNWHSPYQKDAGFRRAVDDTHVVVIDAADPRFNAQDAKGLLQRVGADDVRLVDKDAAEDESDSK